MHRFGQWCLSACCYILFTFFALVIAIGIVSSLDPGSRSEEKSYGSEEQRFYLLLVDAAYGVIAGGYDRRFRYGMSEKEREAFAGLLSAIRYKADCTVGQSAAVDGGVSCVVNGRVIDFVDHGDDGA